MRLERYPDADLLAFDNDAEVLDLLEQLKALPPAKDASGRRAVVLQDLDILMTRHLLCHRATYTALDDTGDTSGGEDVRLPAGVEKQMPHRVDPLATRGPVG